MTVAAATPVDVVADWSGLRAQALLGTDRQPTRPPSPVGGTVEAAVLAAALVGATRRRAGTRPGPADVEVVAAPPEPRPVAPERAGQLLALLLDGQVGGAAARTRLVGLWLERCRAAGMVVAHRSLPGVLQQARGLDPGVVRDAVGARGRWLADRNPAWALPGPAPSGGAWPSELPEGWASATARERAGAIAALEPGPEVEAALEAALSDRAKRVRHAAAAQLARLPGSARAARMRARLEPLVRPPGRIRSLGVELPELPGDEELADATGDPPARSSVREWWLGQIIAGAPLDTWPAAPAAVATALSGEPTRLQALGAAAVAQRDRTFADAVLEAGVVSDELLALVSPAVAEAVLVRAAAGTGAARAIAAVDGPWSRPTSVALLSALARRPREQLRPLLEEVALDLGCRLDPSVASEVRRWRGEVASSDRRTSASLGLLLHVLSIRTELRELFPT